MSGQRIATVLIIGFGYLVAVCVSVAATVVLGFAPSLASGGSALFLLRELPVVVAVGFVWTFFCALPGFVAAILIGERLQWDHWRAYALAGLVNAAPSLAMFAVLVGSPFDAPSMAVASFAGGFAGGTAYWFCAGRLVARRRAIAPVDVA